MKSALKKDKYIAVIEISSTAIKTLLGLPKYVSRKTEDISRFKYPILTPVYIERYIDDSNTLDINKFEKQILPEILKATSKILKEVTQAIRIIITGYLRNISNSREISILIETHIKKLVKNKNMELEVLTPERESYLSFISWLNTYNFKNEDFELYNSFFFHLSKGLHIDIGGGTTEVSVFKGDDFSNTTSLDIGTDKIKNTILKKRQMSKVTLLDLNKEIESFISKKLESYFSEVYQIDYSVITGSKTFLVYESKVNSEGKKDLSLVEDLLDERVDRISYFFITYFNNNNPVNKSNEQDLLEFASMSILRAILIYFGLTNYYQNSANLRVGVYYDTKDKIKNP